MSPSPASTPTSQPAVSLLRFGVSSTTVNPGDTVTITWEMRGADDAILGLGVQAWPWGLDGGHPLGPGSLPASGTVAYTFPSNSSPDKYYFSLHAYQAQIVGPAHNGLLVTFPCTTPLFFSLPADWDPQSYEVDTCGLDSPATGPATVQLFEHGMMLRLPGESQKIYVLTIWPGTPASDTGGYFTAVDDTWKPGEIESDPYIVPPEGMYQPVKGFGKAWRGENGDWNTRTRFSITALGWATAPEETFTTTRQLGRTTQDYYFRDPLGRLVRLYRYAGHGVVPSWKVLDSR
jgi:hypothetical protein